MRFLHKPAQKKDISDLLLNPLKDRRLLPNVPDPEALRTNQDRRTDEIKHKTEQNSNIDVGRRYRSSFAVKTILTGASSKMVMRGRCVNISASGILINFITGKNKLFDSVWDHRFESAKRIELKFAIPPGTMPEGLEMRTSVTAQLARKIPGDGLLYAFVFKENLLELARKKKDRRALVASSTLLFIIIAFITLMRTGSIVYFQFNKVFYLYSIIVACFLLSRYLFGALYRPRPVDPDFTPGVSIIIPCFNEETWIQQTIISCVNQDYPVDKLEVLVMDDCSTDNSIEKIKEIIQLLHKENPRFKTPERVRCIEAERNKGKREVLAAGAKVAKHELLVFVDSDSFVSPYAIKNIVQPFKDPKMGGVSGRCDVANTYTNALTKMQSVRYYIAFRIMKAAESVFDAVTCLSGPLACYKKEIVLKNCGAWLNQQFLGQRATFGDDRAMTNFVLSNNRTCYQDTAICSTIVPNSYKVFLKQQLRWKRSWLRESLMAGKYIWRKEPFAALFFYMGLCVPILGPAVVIYNLIYVPLTTHIFPSTFLMGLFLMSALMSAVQLLFKKSTTWTYGFYFCLFYEAVLLWQMPYAMITFWKSTWGTRMTPEDIAAEAQKKQKKNKAPHENLEEESGRRPAHG